jgi:hypothetical protein
MSLCLMSCFRRVVPESEFDRWIVYGGELSLETADLRTEEACKRQICSESPPLCSFNIFLTPELLRVCGMSVSLHPVISFSVINYVVSMRCLTRVTRLIFFVPYRTGRGD